MIQTINFESISLQPVQQYQNIRQQSQSIPPMALLFGQNLNFSTITHLGEQRRQLEQYVNADKIHVNVNFEVIMDMSETFTDFQIIHKHFQTKWNKKYKISELASCDITERDIIIGDLKLFWNLSSSRLVALQF